MREIVDLLAAVVAAVRLDHPLRVGLDGPSAAGKTTLADALGVRLRELGRDVIRASIDDFHRPGHKFRSIRGEWTPQTYYDESYDYVAFRDLVLHVEVERIGGAAGRVMKIRPETKEKIVSRFDSPLVRLA